MSVKGRAKWTYVHLPSRLEQMHERPFGERSEPVKSKILRVCPGQAEKEKAKGRAKWTYVHLPSRLEQTEKKRQLFKICGN